MKVMPRRSLWIAATMRSTSWDQESDSFRRRWPLSPRLMTMKPKMKNSRFSAPGRAKNVEGENILVEVVRPPIGVHGQHPQRLVCRPSARLAACTDRLAFIPSAHPPWCPDRVKSARLTACTDNQQQELPWPRESLDRELG